jgi:hypothetical protein
LSDSMISLRATSVDASPLMVNELLHQLGITLPP